MKLERKDGYARDNIGKYNKYFQQAIQDPRIGEAEDDVVLSFEDYCRDIYKPSMENRGLVEEPTNPVKKDSDKMKAIAQILKEIEEMGYREGLKE